MFRINVIFFQVPCQKWKVQKFQENSVDILCNDSPDGDGEILEVPKEAISCRITDCLDEDSQTGNGNSVLVPLSDLKDCPTPASGKN